MRKLWTQAAAHWLRLTLLWRSGHVLAALFYFCAAQQMTETPDANMPWYMEAYNCQPQAGQGNIPNRPHSNPDVPFWAEKHAIRASDGAAGRNRSFIFFPAVPSRALSPTPVPVRPKNFADRTGKARTHEYASEPESSLLSSPFRPGENGKQGRRQGKTQLLTTVSRAASSEAASPFFGVT